MVELMSTCDCVGTVPHRQRGENQIFAPAVPLSHLFPMVVEMVITEQLSPPSSLSGLVM